jgi:phage N-6-adenine-methyltransferase
MGKFESKFSSAKQDWETPDTVYAPLAKEFCFSTDLAASASNTKCKTYFSKENSALNTSWAGACWLNPPYGERGAAKLSNWIVKAHQETQKEGCTVVMLIPARTNTRWWHSYCMKAAEIRFICGRPKFGDAKYGFPQPLAIVIFKKHTGSAQIKSFTI